MIHKNRVFELVTMVGSDQRIAIFYCKTERRHSLWFMPKGKFEWNRACDIYNLPEFLRIARMKFGRNRVLVTVAHFIAGMIVGGFLTMTVRIALSAL